MGRQLPESEALEAPPSYPWDDWTNGKPWEIRQGEDFSDKIPVRNFVSAMHAKASAKGMKCKTKTSGGTILFQFFAAEGN
jgi:hypothetical protein